MRVLTQPLRPRAGYSESRDVGRAVSLVPIPRWGANVGALLTPRPPTLSDYDRGTNSRTLSPMMRYRKTRESILVSTYVPERQSEYWTSRQIEDALHDAGYGVDVYPVSLDLERRLPADFIYSTDIKLFGLQYKALYGNGNDKWLIDRRQYDDLRPYPWIYYCLSEMKDQSHRRRALHLARFCERGNVRTPSHPFRGPSTEPPTQDGARSCAVWRGQDSVHHSKTSRKRSP